MSKVDAQRAMREARYARTHGSGPTRREEAAAARAGKDGAAPTADAPTPGAPAPASTPEAVTVAAAPQDGLCGHRSINGRSCTRPAGHAEKNHRYG